MQKNLFYGAASRLYFSLFALSVVLQAKFKLQIYLYVRVASLPERDIE